MTRADSPNFRFLADCCAVACGAPPRAVPDGIDGAMLERLALRHRVAAPVLRLLAEADVPIDEAIRARLRTRSLRQIFRANVIARQCARVSSALSEASVRHIFLKGPPLAQRLFGDIAARACKDLDILIHPRDFAGADDQLRALGFSTRHSREAGLGAKVDKDVQYLDPENGTEIELHFRMCVIDALLPTDFDRLWERHRTVPIQDVEIPALDSETEFLYLCAHGAQHAWFRLKWLQDIARILVIEPPEALAAFARTADRLGVRPMVASAVALVDEVFGIAPVAAVTSLLPLDRNASDVVRTSRRAMDASAGVFTHRPIVWITRMTRFQLGLRRDIAYKRAVIRQFAVKPRDMEPLPRWARWLDLPLLPLRLVWRRGRAFRLEKRASR